MGLFSGIKKGLSSVWKGIKKRFKRALGHIGKFMNTGFGKALMVIVSIWTMGAALAAGYAAWGAAAAKEGATMRRRDNGVQVRCGRAGSDVLCDRRRWR